MSRIQAKVYAQAILNLALEKGGLVEASDIAHSYDRLLESYNSIEHAEVITAFPLNEKDLQKLSHQLRKVRDHEVIIDAYTDPTIIGGIKIKIGTTMMDGSIRNKLESLRRTLLEDIQ